MHGRKRAARPWGGLLFITLAIFSSSLDAKTCRDWLVRGEPFVPARGRPGDFDGSTPIPVNVHMVVEGVTYLSRPGRFRMEFDIAAIADQPEPLRNLLLEFKRKARANMPSREREFGGAVIGYEDGRNDVLRFTSNLIQEIKAKDMVIAGLGRYSTRNPRGVEQILSIHTHPNQANPRVNMRWTFPGPTDYEKLGQLKLDWRRLHDKDIEVIGIVLPTGPHLDDIFYRYFPQ